MLRNPTRMCCVTSSESPTEILPRLLIFCTVRVITWSVLGDMIQNPESLDKCFFSTYQCFSSHSLCLLPSSQTQVTDLWRFPLSQNTNNTLLTQFRHNIHPCCCDDRKWTMWMKLQIKHTSATRCTKSHSHNNRNSCITSLIIFYLYFIIILKTSVATEYQFRASVGCNSTKTRSF